MVLEWILWRCCVYILVPCDSSPIHGLKVSAQLPVDGAKKGIQFHRFHGGGMLTTLHAIGPIDPVLCSVDIAECRSGRPTITG